MSDWICLSGGVRQGTITGPLTFLCMINDALSNRDHQVWKYVDDLTIGKNRVRGTNCSLQPSLDSLSSWSQENKLKLNLTKCQVMHVYFGNKEIPDDDLFIANQQLAVVDKVKLLVQWLPIWIHRYWVSIFIFSAIFAQSQPTALLSAPLHGKQDQLLPAAALSVGPFCSSEPC